MVIAKIMLYCLGVNKFSSRNSVGSLGGVLAYTIDILYSSVKGTGPCTIASTYDTLTCMSVE